MKIIIKSTQIESSSALEDYIQIKLAPLSKLIGKIEEKFNPVLNVEVARSTKHHHKGEVYYVELTFILPRKTIRIEQYDNQIRSAIDKAKNRLKVALDNYKEKKITRRRPR
ncbi:MAG: Ribosomal subunit interface protein [Candidatus Wolfebacteria bacterium GW2011_GWC1_43_10]|uniref:Ribosomal subunit interface protein n=2 Tax=Candidatus Wolfeibacteriota TaxID=1752735 RepID=A0A0G1CC57_9BACT|nr:MAG: Ribosomal subunit interface protein [Candidatus Wolfebacteria bacterium GW2011_GWC1_43_10]KKT22738.1 MAG: Ribosomal subunit interface protein [Parcubacteria group bacterium GW2011_GWB1_43_8b]OGM89762.1 MAG: ribosomal subunit interface protein [Candidatus Wolfebacteria bacterium GWA1_42_9]